MRPMSSSDWLARLSALDEKVLGARPPVGVPLGLRERPAPAPQTLPSQTLPATGPAGPPPPSPYADRTRTAHSAPPAASPTAPGAPGRSSGAPPSWGAGWDTGGSSRPGSSGPPPLRLASPWLRLGASLLNGLLFVVTLGVGFLVWTLVLWGQGTNPGKKICGLRVVRAETGHLCTFGAMFTREFLLGGLALGVLSVLTLGVLPVVDALMIFGDRNRRLVDRMASTLVVTA